MTLDLLASEAPHQPLFRPAPFAMALRMIKPEAGACAEPDQVGRLLVRVGDDDREAFEELHQQMAPRVRGLFAVLRVAPASAEELAQETFLTIWRKAHLFDPAQGS